MSETTVTVTVTVRIGDDTQASHSVRQLSEAPLRYAYTAEAGIAAASDTVLGMLIGAYGDFRNPAVPVTGAPTPSELG